MVFSAYCCARFVFKLTRAAHYSLLICFSAFFVVPVFAQACADESGADVSCQRESDPGTVRSPFNQFRHAGNPVDVISGAKQQREIDFQSIGSPLHLSRYYYSSRVDANTGFGAGWRHSYQVKLFLINDTHLRVQQASGRWTDFLLLESSASETVYMADSAHDGYIVNSNKPVWHLPDGRALHFNGSHLVHINYPNGDWLKLAYKPSGLSTVTDNKGRKLGFEYIESAQRLPEFSDTQTGLIPGHIQRVRLPSGDYLRYGYDADRNLRRVEHRDDDLRLYGYGLTDFPNHLTSIVSTRYSERSTRGWRYDESGRVIAYDAPQKQDSLRYEYVQSDALLNNGETLVEFENGRQRRYQWRNNPTTNKAEVVGVELRDCDECGLVRLSVAKPVKQTAQTVLDARSDKVDPSTAINVPPTVTNNNRMQPVPDSLDQSMAITIDGVDHEFRIEADRFGVVTDIGIGHTSLSELQDKWWEGDIERCDFKPLFQRTKTNPVPQVGCLEDLIYLVELLNELEDSAADHWLNDPSGMVRGGAEPSILQECMANPFESCEALHRDFQLAQLSACAYRVVVETCGSQWEVVTPESIGLSDELFNEDSFASLLFYNAETDEYVVAFRGTDDLKDWKDNLMQAKGDKSQQYNNAVELARKLHSYLPNAKISFTGHSLGGGLATAAALSINATASVFNPAALHPETAEALGLDYEDTNRLVSVTTVDGDLLTTLQEPKPDKKQRIKRVRAPGQHTKIAAPAQAWIQARKDEASLFARADGVILHAIDAVLETEETLLERVCDTTPERA